MAKSQFIPILQSCAHEPIHSQGDYKVNVRKAVMNMCLFYQHESGFPKLSMVTRIALHFCTTSASLHFPLLQSTFGRLSHRSAHSPFASKYLGHVSTISEDFITHSRITHHYTFEYSTRTTMHLQNLRKHTSISPTTSLKHHVHRHTSLNIIPA
jgi:hypothetical protein